MPEGTHSKDAKPKKKFVVINLSDFTIVLCKSKESVADTVKVHRNTLTGMTDRETHNGWLIVTVTEQ